MNWDVQLDVHVYAVVAMTLFSPDIDMHLGVIPSQVDSSTHNVIIIII